MNMKIKNLSVIAIVTGAIFTTMAFGGDEPSEEDIKLEISWMAKKLLDMSGKDSYTIESPAVLKPYIGICSDVTLQGIAISCVTPGSQAEVGGMRTGDVVTSMNGINLVNSDIEKIKKDYYGIVKTMKTKDVITMKINRGGESKVLKITVGSLSHPAYTLKITK